MAQKVGGVSLVAWGLHEAKFRCTRWLLQGLYAVQFLAHVLGRLFPPKGVS